MYEAASDVFLDEDFDVLATVRTRHEEFIRHGVNRITAILRDRLGPVRIGIGDFEPAYRSHFATNAALYPFWLARLRAVLRFQKRRNREA